MRWQAKAALQAMFGSTSIGRAVYPVVQRTVGNLDGNPNRRLPALFEMARWLRVAGRPVEGATLLEVGTGHFPLLPVGLCLLGAERVVTVDLHRRINWWVTRDCLTTLAEMSPQLAERAANVGADPALVAKGLDILRRLARTPERCLSKMGVQYRAPSDASQLPDPAGAFDIHFSNTCLEHIPPATLREIFIEAARVLRPNGVAVHFVDPGDHFAPGDRTILPINFLRFSDVTWGRIAGNPLAYCNRLRGSEYRAMWERGAWTVVRFEADVDPDSLAAVKAGFRIDRRFAGLEAEDLCTTKFRVLMRPPTHG